MTKRKSRPSPTSRPRSTTRRTAQQPPGAGHGTVDGSSASSYGKQPVDRAARERTAATSASGPDGFLAATTVLGGSPRLVRGTGQRPVEVTPPKFRVLRDVHPQALGVTYWFDATSNGEPYSVSVHVAGRLRGKAPTGHKDSFDAVGTVDRVLPGSGRVALTVRAEHLPAGAWDVTATPVRPARPGSPAAWAPLRDPRLPTASASGATTFAPLARAWAPGVRLGAWPALVASGVVLGLLAQSLLARRLGLPLQRLLPLSVLACVLGAVGGKAYYLLTHRSERPNLLTGGASVQGFVLVAIATLVGGALLFELPIGTVLDVTAPALLIGMAVGRVGCLLGGCCVGRPTTSRWGVWSSNRHVGVRRIPEQLMESALAGVLGLLATLAVRAWGTWSAGTVFVAAIGAYTAGRQLLFPLRETPRATAHGRVVTLVVAGALSLTAVLVALVR